MNGTFRSSSNTSFLQSFDSVRFAMHEGPVFEQRLLHARIETLFSLLFGQTIVVHTAYGFDSAGFLRVACEVLAARKPQEIYNPFKLMLLEGQSSYLCAIQKQLLKNGASLDAAGNQILFKSSAFPKVKMEDRESFANAVGNEKFDDAKKFCETDEEKTSIECIKMLNYYFVGENVDKAVAVQNNLRYYVDAIRNGLVPPQFDPEDAQRYKLKAAMNFLVKRDIKKGGHKCKFTFDNRSDIHEFGSNFINCKINDEFGDFDDETYKDVLNYVDASYNVVCSESVRAARTDISSDSAIVDPQGSRQSHENILRMVEVEYDKAERNPGSKNTTLTFNIDSVVNALSGAVNWHNIWVAMWECIASSDFRKSSDELYNAIRSGDGQKAKKKLEAHVANINTCSFVVALAENVELDDSFFTQDFDSGSYRFGLISYLCQRIRLYLAYAPRGEECVYQNERMKEFHVGRLLENVARID